MCPNSRQIMHLGPRQNWILLAIKDAVNWNCHCSHITGNSIRCSSVTAYTRIGGRDKCYAERTQNVKSSCKQSVILQKSRFTLCTCECLWACVCMCVSDGNTVILHCGSDVLVIDNEAKCYISFNYSDVEQSRTRISMLVPSSDLRRCEWVSVCVWVCVCESRATRCAKHRREYTQTLFERRCTQGQTLRPNQIYAENHYGEERPNGEK